MFFSDELNLNNTIEIEEIRIFLRTYDIDYDLPDKTFVIRDNGEIIATGSASGNILKYFYAKSTYIGQGAIGIIYNSLLEYLIKMGYSSYFVFTTPNNKMIFQSLGLKEVESTERVILLEGGFNNYQKWIDSIKKNFPDKKMKRGAVIVNCNPMTLGHKYLITQALKVVDELLIFVVEEELSIFPFRARYSILENEFKDDNRVKVLKGGPYIISRATFPTYFIKEKNEMLDIYTELDAKIFAKKIAKDLSISIRFLGTEPVDEVTLAYNNSLKEILQKNYIQVKIIPRIKINGNVISASHIRQLLKSGKLEESYNLLPNSTIEFLKSAAAIEVLKRLKNN